MQRLITLASALGLVVLIAAGSARPPLQEEADGALFLVQFSLGPAWDPAKGPAEQDAFAEHSGNLGRLRGEGRIVLGARYSDKGMIVLRAATEEAARAEIEADPGVVAGIFTFELHALAPFYGGCLDT